MEICQNSASFFSESIHLLCKNKKSWNIIIHFSVMKFQEILLNIQVREILVKNYFLSEELHSKIVLRVIANKNEG